MIISSIEEKAIALVFHCPNRVDCPETLYLLVTHQLKKKEIMQLVCNDLVHNKMT